MMLSAYFQGWFEGDPFSVACVTVGIALCLNQKTTSLKSFIPFPHFTINTLNRFWNDDIMNTEKINPSTDCAFCIMSQAVLCQTYC